MALGSGDGVALQREGGCERRRGGKKLKGPSGLVRHGASAPAVLAPSRVTEVRRQLLIVRRSRFRGGGGAARAGDGQRARWIDERVKHNALLGLVHREDRCDRHRRSRVKITNQKVHKNEKTWKSRWVYVDDC